MRDRRVGRRLTGALAGGCCDVTAVGCEDPALPDDVTFRRDGNRGVMTCSDTSLVHQYIVCEDGRWIGDVPDCADQLSESNSHGNQRPGVQIILRQSCDYLTIMPKLRSTYDRRLIYEISYEGRTAFLRYFN